MLNDAVEMFSDSAEHLFVIYMLFCIIICYPRGAHSLDELTEASMSSLRCIDELIGVLLERHPKDRMPITPVLQTAFRSFLRQTNGLQSRTQYQVCCCF